MRNPFSGRFWTKNFGFIKKFLVYAIFLAKKPAAAQIPDSFPATILYDVLGALERKNIEVCRYFSKFWYNTVSMYNNILPLGSIAHVYFLHALHDRRMQSKMDKESFIFDLHGPNSNHATFVQPECAERYFVNNVVKESLIYIDYFEINRAE